ncbi:hypothetical protein SUDANB121_01596 [Nocardiopsis dassonvillei]|uniref:DUF6210 family protein n=1 Tax=Nocardiopsis dassonvillei TaxID=2014 RepID=UPI003F57CF28
MTAPRFVLLDPDGLLGQDWLYVVVRAPTGVHYQQQYGGTACRQGSAEGFLVPVHGPDALGLLRGLFERDLRGAGTWGRPLRRAHRDRVDAALAEVVYWACDGTDERPHPLALDEDSLGELDEAWIPVRTPDGPGVLVWCNSD